MPVTCSKKYCCRKFNVSLFQPDQMSNVHCVFTFQGQVMYSPGQIRSSNLHCEELRFEFNDTQLPIVSAAFTVTSGEKSVPLDNPQQIKGMSHYIYKRNNTIVWNMKVCIFRVGCVDLHVYTDLMRGDSLEFDLYIDLHNQRER